MYFREYTCASLRAALAAVTSAWVTPVILRAAATLEVVIAVTKAGMDASGRPPSVAALVRYLGIAELSFDSYTAAYVQSA